MINGDHRRLVAVALAGVAVAIGYATGLVEPLLAAPTRVTANVVAAAIRFSGYDAVQTGTIIYVPGGFAIEVHFRCIGFLAVTALTIAVAATRARTLSKLIALAVGIPLILAVNQVRLVHLFSLGVENPKWFWLAHNWLWEAGMAMTVLGVWLAWHLVRRQSPAWQQSSAG